MLLLSMWMNILIIATWHRNGKCINLHICNRVFRIQEYFFVSSCLHFGCMFPPSTWPILWHHKNLLKFLHTLRSTCISDIWFSYTVEFAHDQQINTCKYINHDKDCNQIAVLVVCLITMSRKKVTNNDLPYEI